MRNIVSIKNLNKTYENGFKAINNLSLDIKKGPKRSFFSSLRRKSYLLLIYMVTSKPKRISLYSGVSHFIVLSSFL